MADLLGPSPVFKVIDVDPKDRHSIASLVEGESDAIRVMRRAYPAGRSTPADKDNYREGEPHDSVRITITRSAAARKRRPLQRAVSRPSSARVRTTTEQFRPLHR